MRKVIYIVLCVLLFASCNEKRERTDQGHTSACWIYAMCVCIEHEAAMRGDDVHLSRQWLMSKELEEQTVTCFLEKQGTISMRNVGPEVLYLIGHYGLIPDQNEKTQMDNSSVLERKLTLLADQATSMQELQQGMKRLLPRFTVAEHPSDGEYSEYSVYSNLSEYSFYYLGARYNPRQFAESVMYYQHWRFYAPSPYHPHGEPFALEVTDNRRSHEYINLSMQEILPMVIRSLREGHAVYWEFGKRTKAGITTSDHAMAIIGIARNGDFICQNSYGSKWGNHGRCLVSIKNFIEHTCNIGLILN